MTPDDFERLATAFRPSWELDEAPFTGAGSLSPSEIRALQGGGVHADVRATALAAAHTSHAPAKPAVTAEEPANKVIVDPGLVAPASVRPPPPAVERPVVLQSAGPWAAAGAAPATGSVRPPAPAPGSMRPTAPAMGPGMGSVRPPGPAAPAGAVAKSPAMPPLRPTLATDPSYATVKKPNTKLFAAAGGAVLVIGAVIWLASGSSDKDKPAAIPAVAETVEKARPSIPPPPPAEETVAAAAAAPAAVAPSRPAAVAVAQPQAAAPPPVVAATSLPQAPQPVAHAAPPPAPVPHPAAAPAPAPAPKPATASRGKGPTIVRDVPF